MSEKTGNNLYTMSYSIIWGWKTKFAHLVIKRAAI